MLVIPTSLMLIELLFQTLHIKGLTCWNECDWFDNDINVLMKLNVIEINIFEYGLMRFDATNSFLECQLLRFSNDITFSSNDIDYIEWWDHETDWVSVTTRNLDWVLSRLTTRNESYHLESNDRWRHLSNRDIYREARLKIHHEWRRSGWQTTSDQRTGEHSVKILLTN